MAQIVSFLLASIPLLLAYLYSVIRWRRFKRFAGFPAMPTSLIWGHMKVVHEQIQTGGVIGDIRRHIDVVFGELSKKLGNPPLIFVDLWPVSYPMLVVTNHEVAEQITKVSKMYPYSVTKSPTMVTLTDLIGKDSILRANTEHWKSLRKRFNPGFAPQHLMTLLPCILDKTALFIDHLDRFVETGEEFSLDYYATGLTFDIIGAVVLDEDFHAQEREEHQSEILKLFRELSDSYTGFNNRVPQWMMPVTMYHRRRIARLLHKSLTELVHRKFAEQRTPNDPTNKSRSVLSLCLQAVDTPALDPTFVSQTCDQLKTFLFAGHDTTSILLQWALYELSRSPRALAAARAELDDVFGPGGDPAGVAGQLRRRGDELLARLAYTGAVIKETLRLHPPAGSARYVEPGTGFGVRVPGRSGSRGEDVCVDGLVLYLCATLIQRDEGVYGDSAGQFVPERWLGDADTGAATNSSGLDVDGGEAAGGRKGGIPASAWRPFERGPRNCIGQELANIEARVFLACAVRKYDFVKVGQGEFELDADGKPLVADSGYYKTKSVLFNKMVVTGKPVDGCVMNVKLSPKALEKTRAERAS